MTGILISWQELAACGQHPCLHWWSSNARTSPDAKNAMKVCDTCPVRKACGLNAITLGERRGIHGGFCVRAKSEWLALHEFLGLPLPDAQSRGDDE
ncbi:WhiB family transcriptional regulator [Nocardia sp. NPDC004711]